ncbi:MAG TPA: biopolymer transporter ExbD [Verrucomicrobiae bacterium]|nr:biopolymer transporter ExbD [Verrucomicrobiae bacterium]
MRFLSHKRRRPPSVIIVSLIDVLLVVLIFLMVSTTAKKQQEPTLHLNLPQSKEAKQGATESKPFVILVTTNFPYFFVGDRAVTADNLQKELLAAVRNDAQVKVAVRADKQAPWGEVTKVIDAITAAKVAGVNFVTERTVKQ